MELAMHKRLWKISALHLSALSVVCFVFDFNCILFFLISCFPYFFTSSSLSISFYPIHTSLYFSLNHGYDSLSLFMAFISLYHQLIFFPHLTTLDYIFSLLLFFSLCVSINYFIYFLSLFQFYFSLVITFYSSLICMVFFLSLFSYHSQFFAIFYIFHKPLLFFATMDLLYKLQ